MSLLCALVMTAVAMAGSAQAKTVTNQTATGIVGIVGPPGGINYMGWVGTDNELDFQIIHNERIEDSPITFANRARSGTGMGMAYAADGSMYVAWENNSGSASSQYLYLARFTPSTVGVSGTLDCVTPLAETTYSTPSLAADPNGDLWLAWTGDDSAHHLNVALVDRSGCDPSTGNDSLGIFDKYTLTATSFAGPAIAVFNGNVTLVWGGAGSPYNLYAGRFNWSSSVLNDTKNPVGTGDDVSLVVAEGELWAGYRGTNNFVYYNVSTDGLHFPTSSQVASPGDTTNEGVGLACDGAGDMTQFWDGSGNQLINLQYAAWC